MENFIGAAAPAAAIPQKPPKVQQIRPKDPAVENKGGGGI
jgi:hypothetical protein